MKVNMSFGGTIVTVREEVAEFAAAMEMKLRKNDHKTGWHDQPIEAHVKLLAIEKMEFDVAYEFLGDEAAAKECVDIANFALIIRDKLLQRIKDKAEATKVLMGSQPMDVYSDARNAFPDGNWMK